MRQISSGLIFTFTHLTQIAYLAWYSVWLTDLVTPVSTTNRNDRQLRKDDGTTNCCCHFFGAFHSKTNMTIAIAYSNEGFETSSLSSPGLLLHRHDFKYFIFQSRSKEEINYLMFLVTKIIFHCFDIVFYIITKVILAL